LVPINVGAYWMIEQGLLRVTSGATTSGASLSIFLVFVRPPALAHTHTTSSIMLMIF
jgi:hypothetical protein